MKMKKPNINKKYFLFLAVFITGASVMILELVGTRILSPFYGSTIYVWSALIAITLGFLSLGYFVGGKLADKKPKLVNMYLIIFFAGISIILMSKLDSFILSFTNPLGPRWGALSSSFILFSIPMVLLGMVMPYAIKGKAKELEHIGVTTGSLYAVSTLGSFVGTILTGFVLIPNLSLTNITNLIAFMLFILSAIWFIIQKKHLGLLIFLPLTLAIPHTSLDIYKNVKLIYETESLYGQIKVFDRWNWRFLLVNGATHTEYDLKNKKFLFPYLKLFKKAVKYFPQAKNCLVIGLGGGGIDEIFSGHGLKIDNVEIDPKVVEVARKYFDFNGEAIVADGRYYIQNTDKKYDLIFFDAFGGYSICPHLVTQEAFISMKNILSTNGILVLNTMGWEKDHSTDDKLEKSIYKTLKEVFPHVYAKSVESGLSSIVFYCSNYPLSLDRDFISLKIIPDEETPVLSDNYNPVETLTIPQAEAWRSDMIKWFKKRHVRK